MYLQSQKMFILNVSVQLLLTSYFTVLFFPTVFTVVTKSMINIFMLMFRQPKVSLGKTVVLVNY